MFFWIYCFLDLLFFWMYDFLDLCFFGFMVFWIYVFLDLCLSRVFQLPRPSGKCAGAPCDNLVGTSGPQRVLFGLKEGWTSPIPFWEPPSPPAEVFASGHTATNTPDLFRTPKLTVAGPGQYWGGGPPGKPLGCC